MLNLHKNHKNLVVTAIGVFVMLSFIVAVFPAWQMQQVEPLPGQHELTDAELKGLHVFVEENCVACHTQQVRNIEMDKIWGERPSIPSDYFYSKQRMDIWRQSPSLLGSERTGPDLTNVGQRQPGAAWHLLHFYNPRIVVKESVMPGYPWLYEEKDASEVAEGDVVVPVPAEWSRDPGKKVVATEKLMHLIAYIQSLKQTPVPGTAVDFIPSEARKKEASAKGEKSNSLPDGEKLYVQTCAPCHQQNGKGLAGAFPPLAGSPIVNDEDPDLMIRIILQGYDARSEYGQMPPFASQLTDEEIAAIASHERSAWGNQAAPVSAGEVGKIRAFLSSNQNQ